MCLRLATHASTTRIEPVSTIPPGSTFVNAQKCEEARPVEPFCESMNHVFNRDRGDKLVRSRKKRPKAFFVAVPEEDL